MSGMLSSARPQGAAGSTTPGFIPVDELAALVQRRAPLLLVDARFNLNVPPNLPDPAHSEEVDYWQPGGIHGTVTLRTEPPSFVGDEFVFHAVSRPRSRSDSEGQSRRVC